jgi:anti-anti-sigma factor
MIVLDASSLEFIGSEVLDVLLATRGRLRRGRGTLSLAGLNKALRDALVLAGIDVQMDLYAGLEEAVRGSLRQASGIERWH